MPKLPDRVVIQTLRKKSNNLPKVTGVFNNTPSFAHNGNSLINHRIRFTKPLCCT